MFKRDLPTGRSSPSPSASRLASLDHSESGTMKSDQMPLLQDINRQFLNAQDNNNKAFEQSRRHQRAAFLEAILNRDESEDQRYREFLQLMAEIGSAYISNRSAREAAFDSAEQKRNALFDAQEICRTESFEVDQASRDRTVQQIRDQNWDVVRRLEGQRQTLLADGRSRRQKVYDGTHDLFSAFEDLLESSEDAFVGAQAERDADVSEVAPSQSTPLNFETYAGEHCYPQFPLLELPKPTPPSYPQYYSTWQASRTISLATPSIAASPVPPSPPHVLVKDNALLPEYLPTEAPDTDSSFSERPPRKSNSSIDGLIREYVGRYESIFQEQEKHRGEIFTADMILYDSGFETANEDIKTATADRSKIFQRVNMIIHAIFADDQARSHRLFVDSIYFQDNRDVLRQHRFRKSQRRYIMWFNQDQTSILKSFELSDDAEWRHVSMLQDSVEHLLRMFTNTLQSQLERRREIFASAMLEYRRRLGLSIAPNASQARTPEVMSLACVRNSEALANSRLSDKETRVPFTNPPMAPESDFSVRTLFRPLFKPSLPTVDSRLNSSDAFKRALLQMLQEQHAAFTRAQAKRQNEFDEALQTKKEMMNIRDMEDGRRFLLVQKTYREAARAWELEFLSAFTKQETERMKQFTEAEKAREQKFLEAAEENEKEFKTLATCENQFYKLMADLEKKTYENEASRTQNMFNWGHVQRREVKSTVEMWKKKFAAEEETRQYAFSILLAEFRLRQ